MPKIRVEPLNKENLDRTVEIFLDAFTDEAFTAAYINLKSAKNRAAYFSAVKHKLSFYKEIGHMVYCAFYDESLAGLVVIRSPHVKPPKGKKIIQAAAQLPTFPRLAYLGLRAFHLNSAVKPPTNLPPLFYTLEGLAVSPAKQRLGIGKTLLAMADEICLADQASTGIYLYTGDEENRVIYEKTGYRVLLKKPARSFTAYHMFKEFNQARLSSRA